MGSAISITQAKRSSGVCVVSPKPIRNLFWIEVRLNAGKRKLKNFVIFNNQLETWDPQEQSRSHYRNHDLNLFGDIRFDPERIGSSSSVSE